MKVPLRLVEKTLSAIQIAKITGEIKTGLLENRRLLESNKVKYFIFPLDIQPKDNKVRKNLIVIRMLINDKKIPYFELSTMKELGKIAGLDMKTSSIAVINPGRAISIFKDLAKEISSK